jgi:hypothetical protein
MFELELTRVHVGTLAMAVPGAIQSCSKDLAAVAELWFMGSQSSSLRPIQILVHAYRFLFCNFHFLIL